MNDKKQFEELSDSDLETIDGGAPGWYAQTHANVGPFQLSYGRDSDGQSYAGFGFSPLSWGLSVGGEAYGVVPNEGRSVSDVVGGWGQGIEYGLAGPGGTHFMNENGYANGVSWNFGADVGVSPTISYNAPIGGGGDGEAPSLGELGVP